MRHRNMALCGAYRYLGLPGWTFLRGYVRVGHRKMGDKKASPCGHKILTGSPERGSFDLFGPVLKKLT